MASELMLDAIVEYLLLENLNLHARHDTGALGHAAIKAAFHDIVSSLNPTLFCDIGAHDGSTAAMVKESIPGCRVFALEANPRIHGLFADRHLHSGVEYKNLAIDERSGVVTLHVPATATKAFVGDEIIATQIIEPIVTGRSSLLLRDEEATYIDIDVPAFSLDDFLQQELADLTEETVVLWIDVEGASHKVLRGATETLKHAAAVMIETEMHGYWQGQQNSDEITSFLIERGFVPVARDREGGDFQFNILFVRADRLRPVLRELFVSTSPLRACMAPACAPAGLESQTSAQSLEELQGRADSGGSSSAANHLAARVGSVGELLQRDIPIFIPAFENPSYVRSMIAQLRARNLENIVVIDNGSTSDAMMTFLRGDPGARVVHMPTNEGPHHVFMNDESFHLLPELFCVTDPDLEFNPKLPADFLARLVALTERFQVGKAGFSLDISDPAAMHDEKFGAGGSPNTIVEWEQQFWKHPIAELHGVGTVYRATIDTTFAVYNKKYFRRDNHYDAVRVAGSFTCRHLPWYRTSLAPADEEERYRALERFSNYRKRATPSADDGWKRKENDVLVIVPISSRAAVSAAFAEAFFDHSTRAELLFVLDEEDAASYSRLAHVRYETTQGPGSVEALNRVADTYRDQFRYLSFMSEDHRIRTAGWDRRLVEAIEGIPSGIAYGNDLVPGSSLPTAMVMESSIVEILAFMAPPELSHACKENFWYDLGQALGTLRYCDDVVVELLHDENTENGSRGASHALDVSPVIERDRIAYERYVREGLASDVARLEFAR